MTKNFLKKKRKNQSYCKVRQKEFITKCDKNLLQSASGATKCDKKLLRSVSGITKNDKNYYKKCQILQSVTITSGIKTVRES